MSREFAKRAYFLVQDLFRREGRLLRAIRLEGHVPILNLHQVTPRSSPFWPAMHPALFEDLLVFLKRNFVLTTFRESSQISQDRPAAIISFDDGYYDFVEYALRAPGKPGEGGSMS